MIDEEFAWEQREITGTTVPVCENCGRPVAANLLRQAGDAMRICADCLEAIARGTAPLDLDEEDDLDLVR